MSDKKISQLAASTTPLAGTEVLPVVQSGVTKQVSVANLTVGRNPVMNYALAQTGFQIQTGGVNRWIIEKGTGEGLFIYRYNDAGSFQGNPVQIDRANGNVRLENNLVIGTAGNGIDFSADSSAAGMTSELLDDYEEGTFSPTVVGTSSAGTASYAAQSGKYTKTGRLVTVEIYLSWSSGTGTGSLVIGGLPFNIGSNVYGSASVWAEISLASLNYLSSRMLSGGSTIDLFNAPVGGGVTSPVAYQAGGTIMITATYSV